MYALSAVFVSFACYNFYAMKWKGVRWAKHIQPYIFFQLHTVRFDFDKIRNVYPSSTT